MSSKISAHTHELSSLCKGFETSATFAPQSSPTYRTRIWPMQWQTPPPQDAFFHLSRGFQKHPKVSTYLRKEHLGVKKRHLSISKSWSPWESASVCVVCCAQQSTKCPIGKKFPPHISIATLGSFARQTEYGVFNSVQLQFQIRFWEMFKIVCHFSSVPAQILARRFVRVSLRDANFRLWGGSLPLHWPDSSSIGGWGQQRWALSVFFNFFTN